MPSKIVWGKWKFLINNESNAPKNTKKVKLNR